MPRGLPKAVKKCLEKSKDSALLAVETYNKPAVKFKSGGYIVLMTIAWTSLFHAIFFRNKIKPFYRVKDGIKFIKRNGDYSYWELKTCIKEYFKTDVNNPIRKNLEFFIPLRNIIEHKSLPEIDADIFSECQAMLLNYDKIIEKEFNSEMCLRECLSFALQLYPSNKNLVDAIISNPDAKTAVDFIKKYRSSITSDTFNSGEYAFKAFLIQVANHQTSNTLPIQFVAYDKLSENERNNVNRVAALVKDKFIQVPVANKDLLLPGKVIIKVQTELGDPKVLRNKKQKNLFNQSKHTTFWKENKIRPETGNSNPTLTKSEYCVYDKATNQYVYTEKWVQFLVEEMKKDKEYIKFKDKSA